VFTFCHDTLKVLTGTRTALPRLHSGYIDSTRGHPLYILIGYSVRCTKGRLGLLPLPPPPEAPKRMPHETSCDAPSGPSAEVRLTLPLRKCVRACAWHLYGVPLSFCYCTLRPIFLLRGLWKRWWFRVKVSGDCKRLGATACPEVHSWFSPVAALCCMLMMSVH